MASCSKCGARVREGDLFCRKCGTKVGAPKMTLCSKCGAQTDEGDLFCHKCGAKIAAPELSTTLSDTEVIKPTESKKKKSFWRT